MNFTVLWTSAAEQALAAIWIEAEDRSKITHAADAIELSLRTEPVSAGESRSGDSRVLSIFPLVVLFNVDLLDRKVKVWAIWRY